MRSDRRLLATAGVVAWVMVGLPVVVQGAISATLLAQWGVAYALFIALFLFGLRRPSLPLLGAAVAAVVVTVLLLCDGFEGALLVLIAMRLGARVGWRTGLAWIAVQTLLLAAAVTIHWNGRAAWLLAPPYLGFQLLAFLVYRAMERQMAANAELRALQEIVADSSRTSERLRIAQELHDALGHHLTALTLNLEAALRRTAGEAHADVEKAQTLARRLLGDVRAIVADQRSDDGAR